MFSFHTHSSHPTGRYSLPLYDLFPQLSGDVSLQLTRIVLLRGRRWKIALVLGKGDCDFEAQKNGPCVVFMGCCVLLQTLEDFSILLGRKRVGLVNSSSRPYTVDNGGLTP